MTPPRPIRSVESTARRIQGPAGLASALPLCAAIVACVEQPSSGAPPVDDATTCPSDMPDTCPSVSPSYQADIGPLIEARCFPCHDSSGIEGTVHDFSMYDVTHAQRVQVLGAVYDRRRSLRTPAFCFRASVGSCSSGSSATRRTTESARLARSAQGTFT